MKSFIQFLREEYVDLRTAQNQPNAPTTSPGNVSGPVMTPVHSSAAGANKEWSMGYNMDALGGVLKQAGVGDDYRSQNTWKGKNLYGGNDRIIDVPNGKLHLKHGLDSTGRGAIHSLGFVPNAAPAAAPAASGTSSRAAPTATPAAAPAASGTSSRAAPTATPAAAPAAAPAGYPEGYISSRYAQVQKQFPNMDHAERMRTIHWNDKTMNPTKLAQLQSYNKTMGPPPIPGSPTIKTGSGISTGLAGVGAAALGGVVSGALGAGTNAAAAAYQHRTTDEKMPMEKSMQSDMGLMWDKVPGESGELQGNPAGFKAARDREKKTGVPYPTYHDWSN